MSGPTTEAMQRFCPRCGHPLTHSTRFCTACGASLEPQLEPKKPSSAPGGAGDAGSERGVLTILGVAAALVVIVIGVALYVGGVFASTGGTTTTTVVNQGSSPAGTTPTYTPPHTESTPAPSPKSPGTEALAVVNGYWSDIEQHNFVAAYADLDPGTAGKTESEFIQSEAGARIKHVSFKGKVGSSSSSAATIDVDLLVTEDVEFGCRTWSGYYSVVEHGSGWLISDAELTHRPC